jgi:predicted flap endonuclease-1-like 5' DNA nuclease
MTLDAPLWIFPVLPVLLTLLGLAVLWWALSQMAPLSDRPVTRLRVPEPALPRAAAPSAAPVAESFAPPVSPAAVAPDNLEIVEGIGPKIAGVLRAAGIPTLAALADADVERLRRILDAANLAMAQPETWPAQARLAASGQLDALREMQDRLRAGRR